MWSVDYEVYTTELMWAYEERVKGNTNFRKISFQSIEAMLHGGSWRGSKEN